MLNKPSPSAEQLVGDAGVAQRDKLRRRFPTVESLRRRAQRRIPRFAFDFVDGAANDEACARRNTLALSSVELVPRYCVDADNISTDVELFGRRYSAPFGVAPIGSAGLMLPGAENFLAREAQRQRLPYILATPANASIERIAEIAPDVFWFQLYRFPTTTTRSRSISSGGLMKRGPMCWFRRSTALASPSGRGISETV
jgi:L-lactate dehydrogenase (cytochrome)